MKVNVFLHAQLEYYRKNKDSDFDAVIVPDNAKLSFLTEYYGFSPELIGVMIMNKSVANWDSPLLDNAKIHVYPIIEGG